MAERVKAIKAYNPPPPTLSNSIHVTSSFSCIIPRDNLDGVLCEPTKSATATPPNRTFKRPRFWLENAEQKV